MGFLFKAVISGMCISFGYDLYAWTKEKLRTVDWSEVIKNAKDSQHEIK